MKRGFSMLTALLLVIVLAVPALAAGAGVPHVVDNAGLLSAEERRTLDKRALALSERYAFDFVIVTVQSTGSAGMQAYADDFFDYNDYGYGPEYDGILFLVSMAERDWRVSTCGFGQTAFTDYGLEHLMEGVLPQMRSGDYAGAFGSFLSRSEDLLKQAKAGRPLDEPEKTRGVPVVSFAVCAVLGFGLAFLPMSVLKKQVKNVSAQADARNYVSEQGLQLSRKTDRFLYSQVTKTAKPKETDTSRSSSGGSTTHTSSSGRSHGGAGGKF